MSFGVVEDDRVEQIKGVTYSLDALLGYFPDKPIPEKGHSYIPAAGRKLYSVVIYLAPGDYHRFHSPTEWNLKTIRHFAGDLKFNCSGELFSVSPTMASSMSNLFVLNERVALIGDWQYGLFTMTPVGATNVGSVVINCAPVSAYSYIGS